MATQLKDKQVVKKEDVGQFPPPESTGIALLKPPTTLAAPGQMSEAEKAFLDESKELPSGPTKLPVIAVNHDKIAFHMPDGSLVDGSDGLCGFVIAHFVTRTYYEKAFELKADKTPPDCRSMDSVKPDADVVTKQNHDCLTCRHNAFGTAKVGKGKACKEYVRLFLVNPEFGNPPIAMLTLPPTSIGIFYGGTMQIGGKRGYLDQLKARHRAWQIVWTRITLSKKDGERHCTPQFEMGDVAEVGVAKSLAAINNQYVDAIKRMRAEEVGQEDK